MAGGTYVSFNKKQPGVYFNRKVIKKVKTDQAQDGIVVYPFNLDWGKRNEVIEIESLQDCFNKLGYYYSDPEMRPIVEMFRGSDRTQGAKKVYVIIPNVASQAKASATLGDLTIQAACYGKKGNKISTIITPDFDTEYETELYAVHKVQTLVDNVVVYTKTYGTFIDDEHYTPATLKDLVNNEFVNYVYDEADKDELLTDTAGITLAGGNNSDATDSEMSSIIDTIDNTFFNILCYDGDSSNVKKTFENFIQRLNDNKGYWCQLVTSNYYADFEGTISIVNGMKLSDGYVLDERKATWWFAGCCAGAKYYQSLTHKQHPLAIDVTRQYTSDELDSFIDDGQIVFIKEFNTVMIMKDINTLHTFTQEKGQSLQSNKLVRTLNDVCNYCNYYYNLYFIGELYNDPDGRDILKGNISSRLNTMQANHGIKNFNSDEDVIVNEVEEDPEAVEMIVGIQGTGAIEKIYLRLTTN